MVEHGAPENRAAVAGNGMASNASDDDVASSLRGWRRVLLVVLYWIPKNAISRLAGRFASLRLPGWLQRAEIRLFARLSGADLAEAREPIGAYDSLQRFFTRALREGARPIDGDAMSLVAPCDGAWGAAGRIEAGTLLQVKGRRYSLAELLGDPALGEQYEGGTFATFYLSPRDYHRFHTPAAGRIRHLDYHPGSLWPVNEIGLGGIDGLFVRNERICAYLDVDSGGDPFVSTPIALVAVGATMVGSVRLSFDDLRTNQGSRRREHRDLGDAAPKFARGEEWGHFEFGSTIVMLVGADGYDLDVQALGRPLRLGEAIGRMTPSVG
jgi:phosphatidylserine decarboxylase